MHNPSISHRRAAEVGAAIERAKEYAREQGVPLTAERLAAELDMDLTAFRRVVRGDDAGAGSAQKADMIRRAYREATASVMEHAMKRGTGSNMHIFYLKNNAGYDASPEEGDADSPAPVVFVGEEALLD